MNKEYALSRLAQIDRKIKQMETELRQIKRDRVNLKAECAKTGKKR